jgi:hypothetical protein
MTVAPVRVSPTWLRLRESADAAARASDLIEHVRRHVHVGPRAVIHDLACGIGSMGRWLAPHLAGPQHWIMYDWDSDLLAHAGGEAPVVAADGSAVTAETRRRDVTRLEAAELEGASLITASALLDMMTEDQLERFVSTCLAADCPVLVTISVIGHVDLCPPDPLDPVLAGAFNAHQRRMVGGHRLLGPDAVGAAVAAFRRRGANVLVRPSPWRLDAARSDQSALAAEWLSQWLAAACEQQPELTEPAAGYARRRRADAAAGRLHISVHHHDLLVRPRPGGLGQ